MKLLRFFIVILSFYSSVSLANFNYQGAGNITYPTGVQKPFEFGFAWQKQQGQFQMGQYKLNELPKSYSVAITLSPDEQQVYVQEFANGYISEFEWQLGKHFIALKKKKFAKPVRGDYVLTINDNDYFLLGKNATIKFVFNEDGIDYITPVGITRDMGKKK